MKKKLLIGLSSVGLAAGFWACGDGTVEPLNEATDGYVKAMLETQSIDFASQVADAKKQCSEDIVCMNEMAKANNGVIQIESSETIIESSSSGPATQMTSSSRDIFGGRSSMGPIGQQSSSSVAPITTPSSSSAAPVAAGVFGTCAPKTGTVELNSKATWEFTWSQNSGLKMTDINNATYTWTFAGGTPATGTGRSTTTTYAASGEKATALSVTAGGVTQDFTCTPINVNGSPITGCECVGTNLKPDVAAGEAATWTIANCKTGTGFTLSYTWTGATAADATGLTATAPVAAKNDVVTGVSVLVENDDNTKVPITCDPATAVDSRIPDYELKFEGSNIPSNTVNQEVPFNKEACIQVAFEWQNSWTPENISVLCDVQAANGSPGLTLDLVYNGKTTSYTGSYNISNSGVKLGAVKQGTNTFKDICVTVTGTEGGTAKCFFGN
jgi:hypothetical protein